MKVVRLMILAIGLTVVLTDPITSQEKLSKTYAQETDTCENLLTSVVTTVQEACGELSDGQACYGAGNVTLTSSASEVNFSASGDLIDLSLVDALQTTAANPEDDTWGIAVMKVPTNTEGQSVTLALFGDAQMTNAVTEIEGEPVTLEISNGAGYNVNLREGPGTDYAVAGTFNWNATGVVDGRTADSQWLRIQRDEGAAWVFYTLVFVNGDVNTLPVVSGAYSVHMQAFTLSTSHENTRCGIGSVGLLVQYAGENPAKIGVNGVDLTLQNTTLLLQAQPNTELDINVLAGSVDVKLGNDNVTAETGSFVKIPLGGDDGLQTTEAPVVEAAYPFALTEGMPLQLVTQEELACIIAPTEATLAALHSPDQEAAVVTELQSTAHYPVLGWTNGTDENSGLWWQISTGNTTSWVPQEAVQSRGSCGLIEEIDLTTASRPASTGGNSGGTSGGSTSSVVPAGQTIWRASTGQDVMTGTCTYPPLVMCDHLAAITNNGDTISWRGQEPTAYTLYRVNDTSFSYSGRNKLGNASMNMYLTFNSLNSWSMTMVQVFDNDPACTHTFYYTAVPR